MSELPRKRHSHVEKKQRNTTDKRPRTVAMLLATRAAHHAHTAGGHTAQARDRRPPESLIPKSTEGLTKSRALSRGVALSYCRDGYDQPLRKASRFSHTVGTLRSEAEFAVAGKRY
jgi:hypothetical protein